VQERRERGDDDDQASNSHWNASDGAQLAGNAHDAATATDHRPGQKKR
jgi:hypothetical protein